MRIYDRHLETHLETPKTADEFAALMGVDLAEARGKLRYLAESGKLRRSRKEGRQAFQWPPTKKNPLITQRWGREFSHG